MPKLEMRKLPLKGFGEKSKTDTLSKPVKCLVSYCIYIYGTLPVKFFLSMLHTNTGMETLLCRT